MNEIAVIAFTGLCLAVIGFGGLGIASLISKIFDKSSLK